MNNPKVYQALSVLGFVVSAIFTVKLFASNSVDIISYCAMVATALLYEFGKYTLLYQSVKGNFNSTGKSIMFGIWIFVTCASIIASATYVLNDANANKNIMVQNSTAYKKQEEAIDLNKDLYSTKKQEIENLRKLQEQTALKGEEIKNSMPRNYIDRRQQAQQQTNNEISKIQEQINQKSSELTQIANTVSTPNSKIEIQEESTNGGDSMFKLIAKKLNENPQNKNDPYSTEEVGIFFYIMVGVGLEVLANLFAFLSQYYKHGESFRKPPINPEKKPLPENENNIEPKQPQVQTINAGRLKGIKFKYKNPKPREQPKEIPNNISDFRPKEKSNKLVNEYDINKYLTYIKNNQKNGYAPGRNKIVLGLGFTQEKCRMIHNILIDRGLLTTEDRCTKIV